MLPVRQPIAQLPLWVGHAITAMGLLHFVVSALAFISSGVSALPAARVFARRGEHAGRVSRWRVAS